jgi:hypothetical protein
MNVIRIETFATIPPRSAGENIAIEVARELNSVKDTRCCERGNLMRILRTLLALLPLVALVPAVTEAGPIMAGDTVVLTDGPGNTGGGEFNMFVNGSATSFITFCLQRTQFISFNQPYTIGSVTNYADDPGTDPIESQTAWLYTQLRTNPSAIGYSSTQAMANLMQNAIWFFEGELSLTTSQQNANGFIVAARNAVTNGFSGIGNVRVVNLFDSRGNAAQDQLILQVPGPAALSLVVPGLVALVFFRRRQQIQ